jgi:PhnB protein
MKSTGIYLTFDGNCAEAFAHYSTVFKKKLTMSMTNGESPMKDKIPVELHGKIMHCSLDVGLGETFSVMGSDFNPGTCCATKLVVGTNSQITLTPSTKEETERLFAELSQDGTVLMPLDGPSFWGSYFGALVDKFGIHWMFDFPMTSCADDATENKKHALEK